MKILKKTYYLLAFCLFYLFKLVQSNIYIAWDILTPGKQSNPAFVEVPVILNSDTGLLMFSNLLSMTPGTLSLDISRDKKTMLVHVLYYSDEEQIQNGLKEMQQKIKRITG
ncbi:Na+/H+ ion antiporter subunit [Mariniphaga anaerophila]|uniref:Na+/H+ ion antiporter subunit n=1 Tax=Mariniphaga anaerophila TaxID=1484053 RepID=A0A1M5CZX9_9BACT|nr:Na+/H+ antiporter subunit E [Mariniphaga anaerophila]SHF60251.1 Na+/H+ ion antiporter subunit [Mariniphaga anaerophila]